MKDFNGIDRRDAFDSMCPHEAIFTGIVTEDVPESDKNIIFKFIVSDGSYFYCNNCSIYRQRDKGNL